MLTPNYRQPEYNTWKDIKQRCYNPNYVNFKYYGARGIQVCDQWKDSYENFIHDMKPRPTPNHCLGRIDSTGPFSPENCRWMSPEDLRVNEKTSTYKVESPETGEMIPLDKAIEELGIDTKIHSRDSIYRRSRKGKGLLPTQHPRYHKFYYNGQYYQCGELAKLSPYNISPETLSYRLCTGWTIERALNSPLASPEQYWYNGEYYTAPELSKILGIARHNLKRYLNEDLTVDEIVDLLEFGIIPIGKIEFPTDGSEPRYGRFKAYLYEGKYYTVGGLAEVTGLPKNVIADRLHENKGVKSVEEVLSVPMKDTPTYSYNGRTYSLKEICSEFDVSASTIKRAINTHGSVAKALYELGRVATYDGETDDTQIVLAGVVAHPLYSTWKGIKSRCLNINDPAYHYYGGRGIRICDRWYNSFEAFVQDMGEKPSPNHSIDRINNDGDYHPANCRWALPHVQINNRSNTRFVTMSDGRTIPMQQATKELNMSGTTLFSRLARGKAVDTDTNFNKKYPYKGGEYTSTELLQFTTDPEITAAIIRDRICNKKWDVEKAVSKPLRKTIRYDWNGEMLGIRDIAKLNDINISYLYELVTERKMSIQDAVAKALSTRKND